MQLLFQREGNLCLTKRIKLTLKILYLRLRCYVQEDSWRVLLVKKISCLHKFKNRYGIHAFTKMTFVFSEVLEVFFYTPFDILKDCTLSSWAPRCFGTSQKQEQKAQAMYLHIFMVTTSTTALQTKRKHTFLDVLTLTDIHR